MKSEINSIRKQKIINNRVDIIRHFNNIVDTLNDQEIEFNIQFHNYKLYKKEDFRILMNSNTLKFDYKLTFISYLKAIKDKNLLFFNRPLWKNPQKWGSFFNQFS